MRRLLLSIALIGGGCLLAQAATPVWVTPDVPTDETLLNTTLLPWEIYRYDGTSYTPVFGVTGNPDLNAIHKLDLGTDWLFSVEAPSDLGGALLPAGTVAEARDVIWFNGTTGTYQICMLGAAVGIPAGSGVDAIHMDGGDTGDLIVSFDVPTDVAGFTGTFDPADLVRFGSSGAGVCTGYAIIAANPDFDASAALPGVPISSIAEGADGISGNKRILAFDVPTDLPPAFPSTSPILPGQLAEWNATTMTWSLFETLGGWPISSLVDGLSCGGATPGRIDPTTMKIGKAGAQILLNWPGSCAAGAQDYGIYRGTIGAWGLHTPVVCTDGGTPLQEPIPPGAGDHYYLVVPLGDCNGTEGSYGRCSAGAPAPCLAGDERPVGTSTCKALQVLPTPPACP